MNLCERRAHLNIYLLKANNYRKTFLTTNTSRIVNGRRQEAYDSKQKPHLDNVHRFLSSIACPKHVSSAKFRRNISLGSTSILHHFSNHEWTHFRHIFVHDIIALANLGGEGLTTPFRRIIFGLSISDIFQSLALVFGPVSVPHKEFLTTSPETGEILWETSTSCRANGFVSHVSMLAVVMYVFHLSLYYLCKLKYRMADAYKIERKMHVLIFVLSVTAGIWGHTMNFFHANAMRFSFCSAACWGCGDKDKRHLFIFTLIVEVVIPAIFMLMIFVTTGLLCHHA